LTLAFNKSDFDVGERMGEKNMANPILVTGAAGRTVTELLLKQAKPVRGAGDVSLLHQNVERDEQIQIRLPDIPRRHET
jgi:hypothetical protein